MNDDPWKMDHEDRKRSLALRALKLAYRKHHLGDTSIGWNDLAGMLATTLQEIMGDVAFQKWAAQAGEEINGPIPETDR